MLTALKRLSSRRIARPSSGLVVALLALVFSVGGTAAAAVVINSNSQVGPNTISGHHPPAGKHANIIAGSVTENDLTALPAWTNVGDAYYGANPRFMCPPSGLGYTCWMNSTTYEDLPPAGYYLWHGEVHLKGNVCVGADGPTCATDHYQNDLVIFQLPVGYRPKHTPIFRVPSGPLGNQNATVYIQASTGNVVARNFQLNGVALDGISFRINN
jgi:hypothetical protein